MADLITVGESKTFNYTGYTQTISLLPGEYKLECWGARGGSANSGGRYGGKGGYSTGIITLYELTTLYINIGQWPHQSKDGGWNGGGSTGKLYAGGGATDISLKGINGSTSWNTTEHLYSRIIVAGGGGGRGGSGATYVGGYGGGLIGGSGEGDSYGYGGTQTSTGEIYDNSYGASYGGFGFGASYSASTEDVGAGGGGWYGGSCGGHHGKNGSGGGGSGYVYTATTSINYPSGCLLNSTYYLKEASTTGGVNTGDNGYAIITCLILGLKINFYFRYFIQDISLNSYTFSYLKNKKVDLNNEDYNQTINYYKDNISGFTINNQLQETYGIFSSLNGHVESVTGKSNAKIVLTITPLFSGVLTFYSYNKTSGDPYGYITGDLTTYNDDGNGNNNFKITTNVEAEKTYYLRCGCYNDSSPATYDWFASITYNDINNDNTDDSIIVVDFYYTRNSYTLTVKNGSSDKYIYLFEEIGNLYFNNIVSDPLKKFGYWFNDQYQDNLISCHLKNANFMMPASNMTVSVKFIDQDRVNTNIYKNIFEQFVFDLFDLQNKLANDPYERRSNVFQIDHGFELYDVIKITENGLYKKAIATEEDYDAIGIVSEIINENEFIITTHGQIDYEFVSVSDSTVLYLSDSEPGKLVTYEDITTEFYTPIGFINGDKIMINIMDSSVGNTLKKYQEQLFNQELSYLSQEDIIEVYNEVYNS